MARSRTCEPRSRAPSLLPSSSFPGPLRIRRRQRATERLSGSSTLTIRSRGRTRVLRPGSVVPVSTMAGRRSIATSPVSPTSGTATVRRGVSLAAARSMCHRRGPADVLGGAHGSPRQEDYGKNPRVFGGLQTRGAAAIEVIVVTRPTRRIRVGWALTCGNALGRLDTFSRNGSFVVSRRGQIRIRLPSRPPMCFVAVEGRAESKTNARLSLRIWPR